MKEVRFFKASCCEPHEITNTRYSAKIKHREQRKKQQEYYIDYYGIFRCGVSDNLSKIKENAFSVIMPVFDYFADYPHSLYSRVWLINSSF